MLKFIHFTDTHLVPRGQRLYELSPVDRLALAVSEINLRHADAAFAVVTGDLAHKGEAAAYAALKEELGKLRLRTHLLLGNHDDRRLFAEAFPDTPRDGDGFVQYTIEIGDTLGICLDTNEPGQPYGTFCAKRAAWLKRTLQAAGSRPVIIFIHHPPFKVQLKRMDDISLLDPAHFTAAIAGHGNIRHLFFGHLHRPINGSWRGIPFSTLRATSHQVALDFVIEGRIRGSHEPPEYGVVLVEQEQIVVHTHSYLDKTDTFLL